MSAPVGPPAQPGDRPPQVGRRVVVRYRLPAGSHPPLTDVVGPVVALTDDAITVEGPRGTVTVPRDAVVVVRLAPPAPVRTGRPHTTPSALDLERLMADGWRAVEEEWQGDWLLRASSGFTTRGNSVLPLGDPGLDLASAISRVEQWYAARGLPPRFHLVVPPDGRTADALGAALLERGYAAHSPTLVMTGATSDISRADGGDPQVTVSESLTPQWLSAYGRQRPTVAGVTERVLTGSPGQLFLSVEQPAGGIVAVARMSLHPGWAGLQAVWVDPQQRRRGLGRRLLQSAAGLARQRRIPSMYLQVEADHDPAIDLYAAQGFTTHHEYCYLWRA